MDKPDNAIMLSICIPTYNRPNEFKRMLVGLLPQLTDETEVIVRDDSPNNESKKIFDRLFEGKGIAYQYFSGDKIGLDAANLFLVDKAKGEYVWLFSDDDELSPDAVNRVLVTLKQHREINFMWINYDYSGRGKLAIDLQDGFFSNGDEALKTLGINLGFMSSLVFNRLRALEVASLAQKHVKGFSFAIVIMILHILTTTGKYYFLRGPYILCHPTTGADFKKLLNIKGVIKNDISFNSYGEDFHNILMEYSGKFSDQAIRTALVNSFSCLWRGILVGWVGGWDNPKGKRWRMFKIYWSFPEFWVAIPLLLMPLAAVKVGYWIYKLFYHERKLVFLEKIMGSSN